MELIEKLLMKLVSFGGIGFFIYICSKNEYILKYTSEKRKLEIYPEEGKSLKTKNTLEKESSFSFYVIILS